MQVTPSPTTTNTPRTGVHLLDDARLEGLFLRYRGICGGSGHPPALRRYACALLTEIAAVLRLRGEATRVSPLTRDQIDAARRTLHRTAYERIDPSDLASLIAAEQRHRCLLAVRLREDDLDADERTAIVNGIALADHHLIEYGLLAGRHRQAMKFPDYLAPHSSDDLGPRFAAARWVDQVGLYETLTGQTARKTGNDRYLIACPWHDDKRPSLVIYGPGSGWFCFPCNVGGSPVDFVMRLQHGNAVEALLVIEQIADTAPHAFSTETRS